MRREHARLSVALGERESPEFDLTAVRGVAIKGNVREPIRLAGSAPLPRTRCSPAVKRVGIYRGRGLPSTR
jgi:hypothetical protein